MRMSLKALAAAAAMALYGAVSIGNAVAQEKMPTPVIGVVDVAAVERNSKAWKSMREQIDAKRASFQDSLQKEQQALEKMRSDIEAQRTVLSAEALNAKQKEFQTKVGELQKKAQESKRELDKLFAAARRQIREALQKTLIDIAKEKGINLMLNAGSSGGVFFAETALTVDKEALEKLDKTIQSVDLSKVQ